MTYSNRRFASLFLVVGIITWLAVVPAAALQNPQNGSVGLEGTIPAAPPTQAATIATPSNNTTVQTIPITVSGLCPTGLLIKLFSNNVFVGSVLCARGSYQLQIDLFSGRNDLVARDYDALDQAGPDSNKVTVTFNDAQFATFGSRVSLTSDYARRGANPGDELDWPIDISDGTAPYALSIDWGDGKGSDLQSVRSSGEVTLKHTYAAAGTYQVTIKATDANGATAFLQLVAVANGAVQSTINSKSSTTLVKTEVLWWPLLVCLPLLLVAFWLGRHYELTALRKRLTDQQ